MFYVNENILLIGGYVHCTYEDLGLTPAEVLPISAAFSYLIETKKKKHSGPFLLSKHTIF